MISHDTQLCLTEPEGARQNGERGERDKEGEEEGKDARTTFLKNGQRPFIKTQHPTQRLCLSIRATVLPKAVDAQFADVGTIRSDTKCGD